MTVSCHATGGNPLPTVSITVGGHDLVRGFHADWADQPNPRERVPSADPSLSTSPSNTMDRRSSAR